MTIISTPFRQEAQDRYLTYALSVVSGRALPDVRDGLKPVQRRILYAMLHDLNLKPTSSYKKSATIVGQVLGNYHPHGDVACYEAMVRMAQDFSMRYCLVDGQGNFGSMDGDSAAAYRYTEAKLQPIALEVLGEIDQETVDFRDTFDASKKEPVVMPSRLPNLLVNGATGIAVGMATSIPPHNLRDVVKALLLQLEDPEVTNSKLVAALKGPDFPTGCQILNTKKELEEIYETGRGPIKMRADWKEEKENRGKKQVVITSVPYMVNKSQLVEKIADLIINRKVPQLVDIRDESTTDVRVVLELQADSDIQNVMAYLFKNTPLEQNFNVNLTALAPDKNKVTVPMPMSLKLMLQHFLDFRKDIVRRRLEFEKKNLLARLHILEGFVLIFADLDKAIQIVRRSEGRSDAAEKLRAHFKLTEIQSFSIVDLRIYQLSRTNIEEIRAEQKEKLKRLAEIQKILDSAKKIAETVKADLEHVAKEFGDNRKSQILKDHVQFEIQADDFVVKEEVFALVSTDGWIKRIRQGNDPVLSRLREGDSLLVAHPLNTLDRVVFFTSLGNVYSMAVTDFPSSSGYGDPIQKHLKFKDGEKLVSSYGLLSELELGHINDYPFYLAEGQDFLLVSANGLGFQTKIEGIADVKRNGKRIMKLKGSDQLKAVLEPDKLISLISKDGYAITINKNEVQERNAPAVGISLMGFKKGDYLAIAVSWSKEREIELIMKDQKTKKIDLKEIKKSARGLRGNKLSVKSEILGMVV